jgi:hypothetical protein
LGNKDPQIQPGRSPRGAGQARVEAGRLVGENTCRASDLGRERPHPSAQQSMPG